MSQWVTDKHCQWSDSVPIISSDSVFQGEVWWHDGPRSDGGLRQSLLEGWLSLLGPGETIANALREDWRLQSCDETVWLIVIEKETEKHGNHCHKLIMAMSPCQCLFVFYCFSVLYSSSQVLQQHEEWRGNPFLLQRRRLRRSLDGGKKGGRWRVSTKNVF